MRFISFIGGVLLGCSLVGPVSALSLRDAITYVLESNPNIQAAESDKQAIEFELQRAKAFRVPKFRLEGWAGTSQDRGEVSAASGDPVNGYELSAIVSQRVYDGSWTRSEIERQAFRIDAAALRVLERSEYLALEATRLYADVLRMRRQVQLAQSNIAYHQDVVSRLQTAFDNGAIGPGDLLQGEERLLVAQDINLEFELDLADVEAEFLEIVGVDAKSLSGVPSLAGAVPPNLDQALARARRQNPTILFLQADVGAAEALSRRVAHNRFPTIDLELEGRYGQDLDGIEGLVNDVALGLRMRYEFQGTANRANRQEQVRRVNESRAQLLSQTRLVEREMRQSWNSMTQIRKRLRLLESQVGELQDLRETYETEFQVGARSLLDVLNTQNALVRAQASLINARSLDTFIKYRVLAASGALLPTLGIEPPEDAKVYARKQNKVTAIRDAEDQQRFDAKSFSDWRKNVQK